MVTLTISNNHTLDLFDLPINKLYRRVVYNTCILYRYRGVKQMISDLNI